MIIFRSDWMGHADNPRLHQQLGTTHLWIGVRSALASHWIAISSCQFCELCKDIRKRQNFGRHLSWDFGTRPNKKTKKQRNKKTKKQKNKKNSKDPDRHWENDHLGHNGETCYLDVFAHSPGLSKPTFMKLDDAFVDWHD